MTQTIWIARHANRQDFVNPDWFLTAERRYDPPLSDDGIIQASQLAQRLRKENITAIFSSPFLRTIQTANQVAEVLDLPIKLECGLSEWLNPQWMSETPEKMPIKDLVALFPRIDINYNSRVIAQYPEVGETAFLRAGEAARKIVEEFSEDILLVGHGASVVGATKGLVGEVIEIKAALCCLIKIVRQAPHWVLELNGDTSHLAQVEEIIRFN
ncbi:histidine phosphatase family protein [Synechocystis sp. PCC 7509]|uniref:histidine phosphatase family protein n=1 Tax=Synechocystis sp. PCC 7509 TaxID=927677 RepID=UPI0002AD1206|nr:histidine phosphatase family protein [Synechocystis sp. PCC 7509]